VPGRTRVEDVSIGVAKEHTWPELSESNCIVRGFTVGVLHQVSFFFFFFFFFYSGCLHFGAYGIRETIRFTSVS
jgi:hypothetical protein